MPSSASQRLLFVKMSFAVTDDDRAPRSKSAAKPKAHAIITTMYRASRLFDNARPWRARLVRIGRGGVALLLRDWAIYVQLRNGNCGEAANIWYACCAAPAKYYILTVVTCARPSARASPESQSHQPCAAARRNACIIELLSAWRRAYRYSIRPPNNRRTFCATRAVSARHEVI